MLSSEDLQHCTDQLLASSGGVPPDEAMALVAQVNKQMLDVAGDQRLAALVSNLVLLPEDQWLARYGLILLLHHGERYSQYDVFEVLQSHGTPGLRESYVAYLHHDIEQYVNAQLVPFVLSWDDKAAQSKEMIDQASTVLMKIYRQTCGCYEGIYSHLDDNKNGAMMVGYKRYLALHNATSKLTEMILWVPRLFSQFAEIVEAFYSYEYDAVKRLYLDPFSTESSDDCFFAYTSAWEDRLQNLLVDSVLDVHKPDLCRCAASAILWRMTTGGTAVKPEYLDRLIRGFTGHMEVDIGIYSALLCAEEMCLDGLHTRLAPESAKSIARCAIDALPQSIEVNTGFLWNDIITTYIMIILGCIIWERCEIRLMFLESIQGHEQFFLRKLFKQMDAEARRPEMALPCYTWCYGFIFLSVLMQENIASGIIVETLTSDHTDLVKNMVAVWAHLLDADLGYDVVGVMHGGALFLSALLTERPDVLRDLISIERVPNEFGGLVKCYEEMRDLGGSGLYSVELVEFIAILVAAYSQILCPSGLPDVVQGVMNDLDVDGGKDAVAIQLIMPFLAGRGLMVYGRVAIDAVLLAFCRAIESTDPKLLGRVLDLIQEKSSALPAELGVFIGWRQPFAWRQFVKMLPGDTLLPGHGHAAMRVYFFRRPCSELGQVKMMLLCSERLRNGSTQPPEGGGALSQSPSFPFLGIELWWCFCCCLVEPHYSSVAASFWQSPQRDDLAAAGALHHDHAATPRL